VSFTSDRGKSRAAKSDALMEATSRNINSPSHVSNHNTSTRLLDRPASLSDRVMLCTGVGAASVERFRHPHVELTCCTHQHSCGERQNGKCSRSPGRCDGGVCDVSCGRSKFGVHFRSEASHPAEVVKQVQPFDVLDPWWYCIILTFVRGSVSPAVECQWGLTCGVAGKVASRRT